MPMIGILSLNFMISSAFPLFFNSIVSKIVFLVPGIIKASTFPISSLRSINFNPTSSSNSNGSISVKLAIFGSFITPIVIGLFDLNLCSYKLAESSSGNFKL